MKKQKGAINIFAMIVTTILVVILVICFKFFKLHYFNGFEKAKTELKEAKFTRDANVKYSEYSSYKLENIEFNDTTFYKEIEVEPNTPYKLSCMVKTENVVCKNEGEDGGAVIGLLDTTEYSEPIAGTNDWQKLEFIFNSKERTKVTISFRLGGNSNDCTGTAWFSDFKLEKGIKRNSSNWNIGCFILKNVDVNINGKNYNLKANVQDIDNVKLNMERFREDCYIFSNKKMTANYEIIEVDTPITTISYADEHGYYFSYRDIKNVIYNQIKEKNFDHVFVVARMEDDEGVVSIPIKDNWIGLGGMDIYGIGYSLIRVNKNANTYNYKYGITNQVPEEVYVHEFLHTLERNQIQGGYNVPALHDYAKYGYTEKTTEGLKKWYEAYMRKEIKDSSNNLIGLDESAYKTQPANNSEFKYAIEIEINKEPSNIIEELLTVIKTAKKAKK